MSYLNTEKVELTINELTILLADYHIYYQNMRSFHWNITGNNFFELHTKFEDLYTNAQVKIDELAERILALGYRPMNKASQYLQISSITEANYFTEDITMVKTALKNQQHIVKQMIKVSKRAQDAGDEGTIDLMGSYIRELEKENWILNAWSKKENDQLKESEMLSIIQNEIL